MTRFSLLAISDQVLIEWGKDAKDLCIYLLAPVIGVVVLWIRMQLNARMTARALNGQKHALTKVDATASALAEKVTVVAQTAVKLAEKVDAVADHASQAAHTTTELKENYEVIWQGIIARGYVEAAKYGHLVLENGLWTVSPHARVRYTSVTAKLRSLRFALVKSLEREPTDAELSRAMELDRELLDLPNEGPMTLQTWMLAHACPNLGVNQHGCLAIACVLAREDVTDAGFARGKEEQRKCPSKADLTGDAAGDVTDVAAGAKAP